MTKKVLHWIGGILSLSSILFVSLRLHTYGASLDLSRFDSKNWLILTGLAFLFAIGSSFQAFTWRNLLVHFGAPVSQRWALKIYGISQLAKYIPGNIFHVAGRQALGMGQGVSGKALAKSTFWELGLSAIAAAFFALPVIPLKWPILSVSLSTLIFSALIIGVCYSLRKIISAQFSKAIIYEIGYLLLSGLIFVKVLTLTTSSTVTTSPDLDVWKRLCDRLVNRHGHSWRSCRLGYSRIHFIILAQRTSSRNRFTTGSSFR